MVLDSTVEMLAFLEAPPYWKRMLAVSLITGDLKAIRRGDASVVTDHIDRVVESGVVLKSGRQLEADMIVTATGLDLCILGNVPITVDGRRVEPGDCLAYKSLMLSGVPNLAVLSISLSGDASNGRPRPGHTPGLSLTRSRAPLFRWQSSQAMSTASR